MAILSPSASNLPSTSPSQLIQTRSSHRPRSFSLSPRFCFLQHYSSAFQLRTLCGWNKTGEEHFGHFKRTVWHDPKDTEFRFYNRGSQHEIAEVADDCHKLGASCLSASSLQIKDESRDATKVSASNTLIRQSLKSAILFGLLTFQGTEQALAASDFLNSFQSTNFFGDLGDISTGFASAFLLIFFSELGDKTFFIAALLAARNSAAVVFTGTFGALALMTIISVIIGRTFHYIDGILPFSFGGNDLPIDDIAAVFLLVYFGVTTLIDATSADSQTAEDEQKEAELAVSEFSGNGAGILAAASTVISTFALVFVAEWGDKSFFSTIALAAAASPLGVIGGALAGHGVATLLAVAGGSLLGTFLSEKVIAYTGGILFLVFAGITLVEIITG